MFADIENSLDKFAMVGFCVLRQGTRCLRAGIRHGCDGYSRERDKRLGKWKVGLNQLAQIMTPSTSGALHFQSSPPQHININDEGGNTGNVPSAAVPNKEGDGESSWDLFMGNPMVGLDQREILDLARLDVDSLMHTVGI